MKSEGLKDTGSARCVLRTFACRSADRIAPDHRSSRMRLHYNLHYGVIKEFNLAVLQLL